jgi:hypothetical protein
MDMSSRVSPSLTVVNAGCDSLVGGTETGTAGLAPVAVSGTLGKETAGDGGSE